MTKTELAALVAAKTGLTKKAALETVDATFDAVKAALAEGKKVSVAGFGSFEAKERKARTAINPRTKETVEVAATRVPKFTAGKALKDAVK
jgi:DNA-binding protein HU-beta